MNRGITFDNQLIQSADMAHFLWVFSQHQSGVTQGCTPSYNGTNLYVASGRMILHGRQVAIEGTETIAAPDVPAGVTYFCRLVYKIDLSQTNTTSAFNQGFFLVKTSASAWPTLTQEDLDDNGQIYEYSLARFKLSTSGISEFADERKEFETWLTGTLAIGQTTVTISNASITTESMYDIYTDVYGAVPKAVTVANGSMTLTFNARSEAVNVKVRVF